MGKPDLSGSLLTVYHRTRSEDLGGSICSIGFIAGGGKAYGTGIYSTYTYESSTRNSNMGAYGSYIVKGEVDINGFLILDYDLAKQVYGSNYKLTDQIRRIVGEDKVINSSLDETNQRKQIEKWSNDLENIQWSSDVADTLSGKYGLDKTGLKGIIFSGRNDGNVCLIYIPLMVTPIGFAKVDGATYLNPEWKSCPEQNIAEMREMREDKNKMEIFADARMELLSDIKSNKNKPTIDIRKENHPNISDNIFDQFITNILWENESRINKLTPQLRSRVGDVLSIELLIKKLTRNPKVHWEEWKKQPQEVRDKISHEMMTEIWEEWLSRRPGHWKMLPEDVKGSISKKGEGEYWAEAVKRNPANWRYVPAEISEYIIDNKESLNVTKIPSDEEFVDHKKKLEEVELDETEAFEIPEDSVDWVQAEVGKMNRKAQKLGLPDIVVDDIGDNRATNTRTVKIIGNVPIIKGVKLLAKITKFYSEEEDEIVTEVEPLTDETFPQENWEANPIRCDHCAHNRDRKRGYIVKNENAEDPAKQYMMIGSTCIDDFISELPGKNTYSKDQIKGIANYAYKFKQMVVLFQEGNQFANKTVQQIRTAFKSGGVPILFFLSRASYLNRTQGFVKGKYGTGKQAYNMCIDGAIDKPDDITAEDISFATNAIEWINNKNVPQPADGDKKSFMWDLKEAASASKVKSKTSSLIGWLINVYMRDDPQKDPQKILGSDGQAVTLKGQLVMKNPVFVAVRQVAGKNKNVSNDYCVAENDKGMRVAWSSVDNVPKKVGDVIIVSGIINGTATVDGQTATCLKDVQEIPEEQFIADTGRMDKQTQNFQKKSGGSVGVSSGGQTGQYGHGDIVDEDFTIVRVDPRDYRGSKRYTVSPVSDPKAQMSSFVKAPIGNAGDIVKLRGKIEVNGRYTNLIIDPNGGISAPQFQPKRQPQPLATPQRQAPQKAAPTSYGDGDKVEDDFKIIRVDKAQYGSLRYTLINRSRVQLSSFIKGQVGNVGDVVRLSGVIKIKGRYTNLIVHRVLPNQQPVNTQGQTPVPLPSNPAQVTPQGPVVNSPLPSATPPNPSAPVTPTAADDISRMIESSKLTWFEKQRVFAGLKDFMPWLNKKEDLSQPVDNSQPDDSVNDSDGDQRKFKYPDEINLTDAYGQFKDSYEKATGKSWTEEKFKGRAAGWIFYGDENGYIAIRPQRSGLYKLVGVAGNEENPREKVRSIRNAFSDLTSEGKPVWGMVSSDIKGLLEKHGFASPPALAIKTLIKAIPSGVLGGADVKKILPDGGVELEYSDVGSATKYFVANKEYYGWLRGEVKNNPKIPKPAKFIIEKAIGAMAKVLSRTRIFKIADACNIPSFISVEDV